MTTIPHRFRACAATAALAVAMFAGAAPARADDAAPTAPADTGRRLYSSHCARCHGPAMVTPGTVAYDLRRFPEDQKPRFALSVLGGRGAMPAWNGILDAEAVDALWAYVLTRGR